MVTTRRGMAAIAILLAASTLAVESQPAELQTIRVGILSPSTRPSEGPGSLGAGLVAAGGGTLAAGASGRSGAGAVRGAPPAPARSRVSSATRSSSRLMISR